MNYLPIEISFPQTKSKKNTDRKIRIIPTDLPRFTSLRYIIIKIIIKFKNMDNMSFLMIRLS